MGLIIRSSDIHAAGCYTTSPIRKGAKVVEYTGPRITKRQGDRIYDSRPVTYLFGVEDDKRDTVIDGHGMAMFINHSCDPNCVTEQDDNGRVWVTAVRDIKAGEELTYDYLLYDGDDDAPCHCGSPKCRGTMYSPEEAEKHRRRAARQQRKMNIRRRKK
jgi:SET domain-containing protein